jgi:hypothetical protein
MQALEICLMRTTCEPLVHPKITVGNKARELAENVFKSGFYENLSKIVPTAWRHSPLQNK